MKKKVRRNPTHGAPEIGMALLYYAVETLGDPREDGRANWDRRGLRQIAAGCIAQLVLDALGVGDDPGLSAPLRAMRDGKSGTRLWGSAKGRALKLLLDDETTATAAWIVENAVKVDPLLSAHGLDAVVEVLERTTNARQIPLLIAQHCVDPLLCAWWEAEWDTNRMVRLAGVLGWQRADTARANKTLWREVLTSLPSTARTVAREVAAGVRSVADADDMRRNYESTVYAEWRASGITSSEKMVDVRLGYADALRTAVRAVVSRQYDRGVTPLWALWPYQSMLTNAGQNGYEGASDRLRELLPCPSLSDQIAACDHDAAIAKDTYARLPSNLRIDLARQRSAPRRRR